MTNNIVKQELCNKIKKAFFLLIYYYNKILVISVSIIFIKTKYTIYSYYFHSIP